MQIGRYVAMVLAVALAGTAKAGPFEVAWLHMKPATKQPPTTCNNY